jgi:hypothetical protein
VRKLVTLGPAITGAARVLRAWLPVSASSKMNAGPPRLRLHVPDLPDSCLTSVDMNATGLMIVPVRTGSGMVCLRCGRLPGGERVGIAFTTEARLAEVMGAGQEWIHLNDRAMKAMLAPLGVHRIQVDPGLVSASLPISLPA